jgi:hypothetical protein
MTIEKFLPWAAWLGFPVGLTLLAGHIGWGLLVLGIMAMANQIFLCVKEAEERAARERLESQQQRNATRR